MILHGCAQLCEPQLLHVLVLLLKVCNLIVVGLVCEVSELTMKFLLHRVGAEVMNELQDVRLNARSVTTGRITVVIALEQVTIGIEWLHFHSVNHVHSLENLFALGL